MIHLFLFIIIIIYSGNIKPHRHSFGFSLAWGWQYLASILEMRNMQQLTAQVGLTQFHTNTHLDKICCQAGSAQTKKAKLINSPGKVKINICLRLQNMDIPQCWIGEAGSNSLLKLLNYQRRPKHRQNSAYNFQLRPFS